MRLDLIEDEFRLPALMISRGQFGGRDICRVGDIGDQRYDLFAVPAVSDLVIDGPDVRSGQVGYLRQAVPEPVGIPRLPGRLRDERQVGAVGKPFQEGKADISAYPEESICPGADYHPEILVAVEPGISQHEHSGPDGPAGENVPGKSLLTLAVLPDGRGDDRVSSAFGKRGHMHKRESAPPFLSRVAEVPGVLFAVRGLHAEAVDRHQPSPGQPGALRGTHRAG